jgi:hypothetical protein
LDGASKPRAQDSGRIDVHDENELRYWAAALSLSPQELIETVEKVGAQVADVRRFLGR